MSTLLFFDWKVLESVSIAPSAEPYTARRKVALWYVGSNAGSQSYSLLMDSHVTQILRDSFTWAS